MFYKIREYILGVTIFKYVAGVITIYCAGRFALWLLFLMNFVTYDSAGFNKSFKFFIDENILKSIVITGVLGLIFLAICAFLIVILLATFDQIKAVKSKLESDKL